MTNDKLLSYTVVQEFGAPYWTADLTFEGSSILEDDPNIEGYFDLYQTDTTTEAKKLIFSGFPIKLSWKIKKGIIQYTVRAVTNGWYLTQQNVPKGSSASQCVHYNIRGDTEEGPFNVIKYARKNEKMLLWNFLWNTNPTDPERGSYCSDRVVLENLSDVTTDMADATLSNYPVGDHPGMCGIYASPAMISGRGDLGWDCADCLGKTDSESEFWEGDRRNWAWDHKTTSKFDAITEMADYCNRIFHFSTESGGKTYAYWTNRSSANNNLVEPFSTILTVNTSTEHSLIDIKKVDQFTERAKPNCIYTYSVGATTFWDSEGEEEEGCYPTQWYNMGSGSEYGEARYPVMRFKTVNDLNASQIQDYAEEYYNRISGEEGIKYVANFVSTLTNRTTPYTLLLPGSRIKITGIDSDLVNPSEEFRIMKITHRKKGGEPAMTSIEFSKVYDIAHPYQIVVNPVEELAEKMSGVNPASDDDTSPSKVKSQDAAYFIEPCLIDNISNGLATVRILNSTVVLKNVIHLR